MRTVAGLASALAVGAILILVAASPGGATDPGCWVDIIKDLPVPVSEGAPNAATESEAIAVARAENASEHQARARQRRSNGGQASFADHDAFAALRDALLRDAQRSTSQAGRSEWTWTRDGKRAGGFVTELGADGVWRVTAESVAVPAPLCTP